MCIPEEFLELEPDDEKVAHHGAAKVPLLADEELLRFYDRLHHPSLNENKWIPLLEAEIKSRGLRRLS